VLSLLVTGFIDLMPNLLESQSRNFIPPNTGCWARPFLPVPIGTGKKAGALVSSRGSFKKLKIGAVLADFVSEYRQQNP
jgi:hypothetical protein